MFELVQTLTEPLELIFVHVGIPPEDARQGLEEIRVGLAQLALEATEAETKGIHLSDAVRDAEQFPRLYRLHLQANDLLNLNVPPEVLPFLRHILCAPPIPDVEGVRLHLARVACGENCSLAERALARFVLFEAVRFNLLIATWSDRPHLIRRGLDEVHLDQIADQQVLTLLANSDVIDDPDPVRPLHVLVAAAMSRLTEDFDRAVEVFGLLAAEVRSQLELRARFEEAMKNADPRDALLMMNEYAAAFGEQTVRIERLAHRHPLILGGEKRNTLDQRARRARTRLENEQALVGRPSGMRFIDVIREALDEQEDT